MIRSRALELKLELFMSLINSNILFVCLDLTIHLPSSGVEEGDRRFPFVF